MRKIIAVISDLHAGCNLALLNPTTKLLERDGREYAPKITETQLWEWDEYTSGLSTILEWANGDPLVLLVNGDITHGTRFMQELISTRAADQFIIARDNLEPWYKYDNLTAVRMIAGTGVHGFSEASTEVIVSTMLKEKFSKVSTEVLFHALIDIGGVAFDVAHHGPSTGSRAWLRGNVARYYLQSLMMTYILRGETPPRVVLRAHYHTPVHELVEIRKHTSEIYVTPSWCALDEHAQKATRSVDEITIGGNAYEITDGELTATRCLHHTLDVRQKELL